MVTTKYRPGQSGNPKGRAKGSKNKRTLLLEALEKDLPALLQATKEKALEGDTAALRLLLERTLPAKKAEASMVIIPNLAKAKSLSEKAQVIMNAIGDGSIPPDIGGSLITALGSTAKIIELDELTKRIEVLENA